MRKLIISGRTNWEKGFYIKFKAEEKSMKVIKKILENLGSGYFVDNQIIPKTFSKYDKWKDHWIPINIKNLKGSIICGDKFIHMHIHKSSHLEFINNILGKYCSWVQIKRN